MKLHYRKSVFVHVLRYNIFLFFFKSNGGLIRVQVITSHDTYSHPGINDPSKIYL